RRIEGVGLELAADAVGVFLFCSHWLCSLIRADSFCSLFVPFMFLLLTQNGPNVNRKNRNFFLFLFMRRIVIIILCFRMIIFGAASTAWLLPSGIRLLAWRGRRGWTRHPLIRASGFRPTASRAGPRPRASPRFWR